LSHFPTPPSFVVFKKEIDTSWKLKKKTFFFVENKYTTKEMEEII
jgi:hypothetical protein